MNTFGKLFRLTDFGETDGKVIGGVIDGFPAGITIDYDFIQNELNRRIPSDEPNSTKRKEEDRVEFLSGIREGQTTGAPIGFIIPNQDVKANPDNLSILKPSHSSFTYKIKYGAKDNSYCGRASARQSACRVVGGALAKIILRKYNITIESKVIETGKAVTIGDTFGAIVGCTIHNLPAGLGEPIYDKFDARLAYAMLSINAAKGFEIGKGFEAARMCGSQYNDIQNSDFTFRSNHDGGIQAGITNGQDINFSIAFKPIPTLQLEQETIDFEGNPAIYRGNNRNDLCAAPRVLPIVEAMAALVTVDFLLISKTQCL